MKKLVLAAAATTAAVAALAGSSSAHRPGCSFAANNRAPVGHPDHVYRAPHGCVSLALPRDVGLPAVIVRQHDRRNRVAVRRFRAPATNLHRGSLGMAGRSYGTAETIFVVTWPFVTIVGREVFNAGGRQEHTDLELAWTLRLSPGLKPEWTATREEP